MTHTSTEHPSDQFMQLWQAYCDKKSECEDLRERIAELEASQAQRVPLDVSTIAEIAESFEAVDPTASFWVEVCRAFESASVLGITQEKP